MRGKQAFGWPGLDPKWTRGSKDAVGTAYSTDSRVWFTVWRGTVTEMYYPTVDRPQLRDLEYLVTDGSTFFHEEKRHLESSIARLSGHVLGYRVVNSDPEGRYYIQKEIISDPHLPCLLQHTTATAKGMKAPEDLRLYALCAPHLGGGGRENNARVVEFSGRRVLTAEKGGTWLALGATAPFSRVSCGFVGYSDGWTDISADMRMDWEFDEALDGNVALTGELDLSGGKEFTLGLAFGDSLHNAVTTLFQSLGLPFVSSRGRFIDQWKRPYRKLVPLGGISGDGGELYRSSYGVMLAHEDKSYPGAFIASMSIPWGESKGDEDSGGYHLVWTRDLVKTATALLAAGDTETPLRALIYLAVAQDQDGGFAQNFWIDGEPYWRGVQLDEVAIPIILAWRLWKAGALGDFDPYPMVIRAAGYLVRHGPVTQQERWEEASGFSPSTLASNIAALICAAQFARGRKDEGTALYLEDYADFLECHVESWTVTTQGSLVPGIPRHYIRILPAGIDDPAPVEDPNVGNLKLNNIEPGHQDVFPAKEVVDAGFLNLVRYGVRRADDPIISDSLRVVDALLKVDTPFGPCWHRYNHDGYGQRDDGGPYVGWGTGRAWPLLTGERGVYEVAAGRDPAPLLKSMERMATSGGLLPEQIWDAPDMPVAHLEFGRPTGSAMPLVWAHAEYMNLLRSAEDRKPFDLIPAVAKRYVGARSTCRKLEVWKLTRRVRSVKEGYTLRVQTERAFVLHWSMDEWKSSKDQRSVRTELGVEYVDLEEGRGGTTIVFTFLWADTDAWDGHDYKADVVAVP
jgi:glucoamylase